MSGDLANLAKVTLAETVGSTYRVSVDHEAVDLELVTLRDGPASEVVEQFTLVFRGPPDAPLRQATYPVTQTLLGEIPLFLVPVGRDARGYEYEAVFNRFLNRSV